VTHANHDHDREVVTPLKAGKQRGSIKGTDDQILGIFADKMHLLEPGAPRRQWPTRFLGR
jgi:hypothetical protein